VARRSDLRGAFARSAGIAVTVVASALVALGSVRAQPAASGPSAPTDSAQAAAHYAAGRWTQSADAYRALLRADTTNVFNWYRYGVSLEETGQYKESINALRHALRAQPPLSNQVRYRLAKAHAGLGARDSAIVHLDAAAGGGLRTWEAVKADSDFAPLHGNPRFTQALAHIESNRFPCRQAAESRQLDFWVGDWTVVSGSTVLGANRIERVNGDCMLQENWQSNGGGGGGKSWSYYDPTLLKWKQLFIFDNGGVMDFTGGPHDGTMRFETSAPATATSPAAITRMTYFPIAKDTVRQLFQRSTDGGKTWSAGFDGFYVRKPGTTP
jgi:tetratricopeptide (TPR) repeat protein